MPPPRLPSLTALLLLAATASANIPRHDLGPLYYRDTDLHGRDRTRAAGPFFESLRDDAGDSLTAVRPFYSRLHEAGEDRTLHEYLWPLAMRRTRGTDAFWRVLTAYGNDFDTVRPDARRRSVVFPFAFWGTAATGEDYVALFPVGGVIREYLGFDRVAFALFPLYSHVTHGSIESYNVLWPLISVANGDDYHRLRVLPFYARATKENQWRKTSVLWPLWTSVKYLYPDRPAGAEGGFVLFPLVGHVATETEQTWMLLPPFFRWTRGSRENRLLCPWPFIQVASGENKKFYIWPLWGTREVHGVRNTFALWPFLNWERIPRGNREIRRFALTPLLFVERNVPAEADDEPAPRDIAECAPPDAPVPDATDPDAALAAHGDATDDLYVKLWPLLSYRRRGDESRFRMLEPWPPPRTSGIEKNWAPLWTLFTHERDGEASEDELLWGLYRHRRDADGGGGVSLFPLFSSWSEAGEAGEGDAPARRRWSVLLGLLGYEREGLDRTLRLLYFMRFRTNQGEP